MPEKPSPAMPDTESSAHEQVSQALWQALRRTDTSLSMAALATLTSACSEVTTLLKRQKLRVRPTKLRAVR